MPPPQSRVESIYSTQRVTLSSSLLISLRQIRDPHIETAHRRRAKAASLDLRRQVSSRMCLIVFCLYFLYFLCSDLAVWSVSPHSGRRWADNLKLTLSLGSGAPARVAAINAGLRLFRPGWLHIWQPKRYHSTHSQPTAFAVISVSMY